MRDERGQRQCEKDNQDLKSNCFGPGCINIGSDIMTDTLYIYCKMNLLWTDTMENKEMSPYQALQQMLSEY
jgi:hypothetical protein